MSVSLLVKCLTGASVVGAVAACPALYFTLKTSNSPNALVNHGTSGEAGTRLGAQSRDSGVSQEVLLRDQQHDDCVRNSAMVRVRDKQTKQEKDVTLGEFLTKHNDFETIGEVNYTPKCSRSENPAHK